jgi:phospholipid transport system substrate-binding protein
VTPTDRSRLAFYESEVKRQRIEIVTRRAILRDALVRLAAIEVPPGWRLAERELSPVRVGSVDRARLLDEAVRSRPEIEAARAGVEALSSKREGMRAKYWPDVVLGGRVRYGVAPNRDRQTSPFARDDFNFLDAGVAVGLRHEWPTGVTGREVAKVSAEIGALEARRTALEEKVSHELLAAVDEWRAAADKIEAAKAGLKAARSWSAFARNGFELGTVPAKDLIDALTAFVRAREALLAMTHEHNVAVARALAGGRAGAAPGAASRRLVTRVEDAPERRASRRPSSSPWSRSWGRRRAAPPDEFVRTEIDALADLLASGAPTASRRCATRIRANADFDGFAREALGQTWATLSPREQKRFKESIQRLLESHYMSKPSSIFDKKKVSVQGAKVAGEEAEVSFTVARKDADVGVVVRLHRGRSGWIAEDVVIDGLSLLEDYRAQFRSYLK